ncbi:MAG: branched-chain amino acid ABC transporter permease [Chloroflexi bacterium]|uniref:Branched-chain amino acid ABC transporter permease n=1 Tax=Candidatus Chlorohelix allophototropha TaxID=3003348 RepID=A0A8T7MAG0_9CHLR|nr:branched-chain amino acid ABC transporter permease [Chloroflexota bacterium]WJW68972.1 branched-chain amino acid ABC transporter permease [Chloroflexota bacterium L227-S17]
MNIPNLFIMAVAIMLSIVASQRKNKMLGFAGLGVLALLLVAAPFISENKAPLIPIFILGLGAVGWNIIGGYTGYAAFGQVAFYGLGAYTVVLFGSKSRTPLPANSLSSIQDQTIGWSLPIAFILAAVIPAIIALLIGLPVLKLKGHYFAIATLGIAVATPQVIANIGCIGGTDQNPGFCLGLGTGLTMRPLPDDKEANLTQLYFLGLIAMTLAVFLLWYISRNKFGYGLFAIRENEEAASVMGVNTALFKNAAFVLAAALTGLAGAIQAMLQIQVAPNEDSIFNTSTSLYVIVICLLGGVGTVWGPFIGTFIFAFIREVLENMPKWFNNKGLIEWRDVIFGLIVVLMVLFLPKGIMQLVGNKGRFTWKIFLRNIRENSI